MPGGPSRRFGGPWDEGGRRVVRELRGGGERGMEGLGRHETSVRFGKVEMQGEWVSDGIGGGEWTTETRSKDDGQG